MEIIINDKKYNSAEINQILGYEDKSGSNSSKQAIMTRATNAGLILQPLETKRGLPNQYIIVENNFILPNEKWVDCYCNTEWEVSTEGRIRRKSTKKLLGSVNPNDEYIRVCMINPQTQKTENKSLNRLIYFSFNTDLISQEANIQIDHINGIRTDNRLINLRAVTSIDNTKYRAENQTKIKTLITEMIIKFGYEETEKKIIKLLEE